MARTVEKLDIDNPEHATFMYDLAVACQDDFLNDADTDIIILMHEYNQAIKDGNTVAFLCQENGENAGIIWADIDRHAVGYMHAGLMPQYRQGFTALHFARLFVDFCFRQLELNSLEAQLPTHNRVAEVLMRRIGFRKYGLRPFAMKVNGRPEKHVLFAMTKDNWEALKNG